MSNDANAPGDANPSGDDLGDQAAPSNTPDDAPHVVYDPLPTTPADTARQQRALRRAYHNRRMPSWVKYIPWVIFPVYGFMRLHDPNYEEHFAQWQEEQRRNYLEAEPE
jgi:hypothetical protein